MRVLVCGGRDFKDTTQLFDILDEINEEHPFTCLIHGAARGADTLAEKWANNRRNQSIGDALTIERYPANWNKYGKKAGFLRNKQMLVKGKPDLVVAFPGGRGTANMVQLAKDAGVGVIEIENSIFTCRPRLANR